LFNQLSLYCGGAALQYKLLPVKVCVRTMTKIWHSRASLKQVDRRPACTYIYTDNDQLF